METITAAERIKQNKLRKIPILAEQKKKIGGRKKLKIQNPQVRIKLFMKIQFSATTTSKEIDHLTACEGNLILNFEEKYFNQGEIK